MSQIIVLSIFIAHVVGAIPQALSPAQRDKNRKQAGLTKDIDYGTHSTDTPSAHSNCNRGEFLNVKKSACEECPPGKYSGWWTTATSCKSCGKGQYSPFGGSKTCEECPRGMYQNKETQMACLSCNITQHAPSAGSETCIACPAGQIVNSANQKCLACKAGNYLSGTPGKGCVECEAGQFSFTIGQDKSCELCAPGYFQARSGKTSCDICTSGHYQNMTGQLACQKCSSGSYSILSQRSYQTTIRKSATFKVNFVRPALVSCKLCPPGFFGKSRGMASCALCPNSFYQESNGSATCKMCPGGKFTLKHVDGWSFAEAQQYKNVPNIKCKPCPACSNGTFFKCEVGGHKCEVCEKGKFQNENLHKKETCKTCSRCFSGTYASCTATTNACFNCQLGRYQDDENHKAACKYCAPGQYQQTGGSKSCLICEKGRYADKPGADWCKACPTGKFTPRPGSPQCQELLPGWSHFLGARNRFSKLGAACSTGKYRDKNACKYCPTGKYDDHHRGYVTKCKNCKVCQQGESYLCWSTVSACTACDLGMFQNSSNHTTTECRNCGTCGKQTYLHCTLKESACIPCASGRYQDANIHNTTSCKSCPKFFDQKGQRPKQCPKIESWAQGLLNMQRGPAGVMQINNRVFHNQHWQIIPTPVPTTLPPTMQPTSFAKVMDSQPTISDLYRMVYTATTAAVQAQQMSPTTSPTKIAPLSTIPTAAPTLSMRDEMLEADQNYQSSLKAESEATEKMMREESAEAAKTAKAQQDFQSQLNQLRTAADNSEPLPTFTHFPTSAPTQFQQLDTKSQLEKLHKLEHIRVPGDGKWSHIDVAARYGVKLKKKAKFPF